jgi:hypothetical protein
MEEAREQNQRLLAARPRAKHSRATRLAHLAWSAASLLNRIARDEAAKSTSIPPPKKAWPNRRSDSLKGANGAEYGQKKKEVPEDVLTISGCWETDYEDDDKTAQANKMLGFYDELGEEKAIHALTHQATMQRRFNSSFL